ncbi:MAG: hypothetical protein ACE5E5_00575 [Phycisphaerae bacterium]
MIKFLRKHNKKLLAVSLVFLMIVFIGGSALQNLMSPKFNPVLGRSDLGKVTQADINVAKTTTGILELLGYQWQYPLGALAKPLSELDWVLLSREVERLGMTQPIEAARASLAKVRTDDQIEMLCRKRRLQPDRVFAALAELLSISQTARSLIMSVPPSEAELRTAAFNALDKISVNAVVLPGRAFIDDNAPVSEDQLAELFEKYRETQPGRGLNFGYFVPPAVKLQYIKIDRDKIAQAIGIPNLQREARKYYDKNKAVRFKRMPQPTAPDEAPAEPQSEFLTWDEAKEDAIREIRNQRAENVVNRIVAWLIDFSTEPFVEVERGKDGYKVAPEAIRNSGYYDEIVEQIPEKLRFPGAITVGQTEYFLQRDAGSIPELGGTYARDGQNNWLGVLGTVVFRNRSIVPKVYDVPGARTDEYVSLHQTAYYPLSDNYGNKFIWRVVDVRPAHAAENIEEVREQLTKDAKLKSGFEDALNYAKTLSFSAADSNLKEAFENDADLQEIVGSAAGGSIHYTEPEPFARASSASLGRTPDGLRVSFGTISNEDVDRCFAMEQTGERAIVITMRGSATVAVVEFVERIPGREDEYASMRSTLRNELVSRRTREAIGGWFDSEQIQARTGYKRKGAQ